MRTFNIAAANKRIDWLNDYDVTPSRARIKAGTKISFKNISTMTHAIQARDGSWKTGPIQPGSTGTMTVSKPGTYEYICVDHPWSIGQLIVE